MTDNNRKIPGVEREFHYQQGAPGMNDLAGPRKLLRDALVEVGLEAPRRASKVLFKDMLSKDYVNQDIVNDYFYNNNVDRQRNDIIRMLRPEEEEEQEEQKLKKKIREDVQKGLIGIPLMEWTMPNNKKLGDCTGQELEELRPYISRFLSRLIGQVAPGATVRETFKTEEDLRKLWGI